MSEPVKRPTPFTFVPLDGKPSRAGYTMEEVDEYMDHRDRDTEALRVVVSRQNNEIALLRGQIADRDDTQIEQVKTIERLRGFVRRLPAGGKVPAGYEDVLAADYDRDIKALRELLLESKRSHFWVDEDCFYSCPKAPDYCGNEETDECTCGAEDWNAKVDVALKTTE